MHTSFATHFIRQHVLNIHNNNFFSSSSSLPVSTHSTDFWKISFFFFCIICYTHTKMSQMHSNSDIFLHNFTLSANFLYCYHYSNNMNEFCCLFSSSSSFLPFSSFLMRSMKWLTCVCNAVFAMQALIKLSESLQFTPSSRINSIQFNNFCSIGLLFVSLLTKYSNFMRYIATQSFL